MIRQVHVTAPSRLHFGMFSFGQPDVRQYGGVGVMVDRPGIELTLRRADKFSATGAMADRVEQFASRVAQAHGWNSLPACEFEVRSVARQHTGLGVGTSLGLSVAAGLRALFELPEGTPEELARESGRGLRSAVGTYGFCQGGLIVEAGKHATECLAPLVRRVALPDAWRFVLIGSDAAEGLAGARETEAFASLPPVPESVTNELCREAMLHLVPAAVEGVFDEFSESLFRFGRLAGSCFAGTQGGAFASPRLAQLVETIRSLGVAGVGQTSWGPTLFTLLPDVHEANVLAKQIDDRKGWQCTIAKVANMPVNLKRM